MPTFLNIPPFGDDPLDEVPLDSAPLVAVIAQVRFPPVASIADQAFIGPFQEELRPSYPVLRPEREVRVVITPDGAVQAPETNNNVVWRFVDLDENWKVSLAPSFLSLDVGEYTNRKEFMARFRVALQALENHIKPQVLDRLGVRYVDRLELTDDLPALDELVRPEVLGVAVQDLGGVTDVSRSISDTEVHASDGVMRARWGVLPANTALDPFHGEPSTRPSWLLDLDMYTADGSRPFALAEVAGLAESFAEHIYRVFRWAVSNELLQHFGGNP